MFVDPATSLPLDARFATHSVLVVDLGRNKGVDDHAPGAPYWLAHAPQSWILIHPFQPVPLAFFLIGSQWRKHTHEILGIFSPVSPAVSCLISYS
ncbi:hypothetical protein L227DRAFT_370759 [Lentinus tigrinus ALCF2SS1-6]|uniref:Uncharacterized protein n=1 Tax=Lentinus tigrinus ALCF2SS1-6 TaxID=1328759 RepID=A0A5C2RV89_9APHY|nr:hypothetical protein L227DRAFT_370759 [Lentinus tigrinus ALCF2SS1-6]